MLGPAGIDHGPVSPDHPSLFTGITSRRWTGLVLIWLAIGLLFYFLYRTARQAILSEIRSHATSVAIAVAAGINPEHIDFIHGPEDTEKEEFLQIQQHLSRASATSPDIRYLYVMRRSQADGAGPADYQYVVDRPETDDNGNGVIDEDERSEEPGTPYDASDLPRLVEAWDHPTADDDVTPDPPYPDLISGYSPIRNSRGQTVAIVGADITAGTIGKKYLAVRAVNLAGGLITCLLITLVVQLYYQQREALDRNRRLSDELTSRNEMLRAANIELTRHNEQFHEELKLAQTVQLGFLPKSFPRQDRIVFDKFYLTCDVLGGDLFDVFSVEPDHVAIYMADVAGHGVSAALISGLLKMAVSSVRERSAIATGHLHADLLQPEKVLNSLNEMLVKEIPEYEFITLIYSVFDLATDTLIMSSAGHPAPVLFEARSGRADLCTVETGTALGLAADQSYRITRRRVQEGDKILFYTDGLVEAMNGRGEEFGEERVLQVLREHGPRTPSEILAALREEVDRHRNESVVSDDFSLLIAEIR
jgi:serine phosphatase RsbU (regulator of sigma subunit)